MDRIMNIKNHKPSNSKYFSGIFSSQCPHVVHACFYKIELLIYSFSYLILCDDDLDKGRLQNDKKNVLRRNKKCCWINATNG